MRVLALTRYDRLGSSSRVRFYQYFPSLEAMACGCAVIVPQQGGAIEFVRDGENGLVVPMINQETCYQHLRNLVENDELRKAIQLKGLKDVVNYYPEQAAYKILRVLFDL